MQDFCLKKIKEKAFADCNGEERRLGTFKVL